MAKKQKKLAIRKTVKSKYGKYSYRQIDPTQSRQRMLSGYAVNEGHAKLAFTNGKLTKAGEAYRQSIIDNQDMSNIQKQQVLKEFDKYVAARHAQKLPTTESSFVSHMFGIEYDRMLYNMNIDKNELVDALIEKYMNAGEDYDQAKKHAYNVANDWTQVSTEITFDYDNGWRLI